MKIEIQYKKSGFTLIELLVVIVMIALMASGIGVVFNTDGGGGYAIGGAQNIIETKLKTARLEAIKSAGKARLIIHKKSSETSEFLRFIGVIYEDTTAANKWFAADAGTYLPKGVVFYPPSGTKYSQFISAANTMSIAFPPTVKGSITGSDGGSDWYYYEFDATGVSQNSGGSIVLGAGVYDPVFGGGGIRADTAKVGGFMVLRAGGTVAYPEPGAITGYDEGLKTF